MSATYTKSRALAVALTLLVLAGAFLLARRGQPVKRPPDTPESVVWSMLEASRRGDVQAYLNCFTGDLERRLRKTAETMGERPFAQYLQQTQREIKGIAVSDLTPIAEDELSVRVEYVYQDKNEIQEHYLTRAGDAWKIREVKGTTRVPTLVPYGQEVTSPMEKK